MNLAKLTYLAVTVGLVVLTVRTTSADSKEGRYGPRECGRDEVRRGVPVHEEHVSWSW
jgi:hypothetical protein